MEKVSIPIALLVSPKQKLDFQKRNKLEFSYLISTLRTKKKVDVPIEVYKLNNGKYFIADGVHRAKAAELAGLEYIDAILYTESRSFGLMIPLSQVGIF